MFRPKLTKIPASGPIGKAIGHLNRAVSDRSSVRTGDGMGSSYGPSGQYVYGNAPILMYAKSTSLGVPASSDDGDGNRTLGSGNVYPARLSIDDNGNRVLKIDKDNPITSYNMGLSDVGGDQYLVLAKILNIWQVIWEECPASS